MAVAVSRERAAVSGPAVVEGVAGVVAVGEGVTSILVIGFGVAGEAGGSGAARSTLDETTQRIQG
ncbi:hypothetical protein GCM10009592_12080 [Brachybacterium rhamnosum]